MNFGEKIKELRIEKQWTQEYVADKLNISMGALSRYETGMYEPKSLELVKDFADLFNVSTDYLLGKTDIRNIDDIKDIKFANENGINIDGLTAEQVDSIKQQVEFMKWKLKQEQEENKNETN